MTSAWAVGSEFGTTRLAPVAMISPSFTMTAPKGPPPVSMFSIDRLIAISMNLASSAEYSCDSFRHLSVVLIIMNLMTKYKYNKFTSV
jgi:hypothetical protein